MTDLLIVSFSRTGGTDALRDAVIAGGRDGGGWRGSGSGGGPRKLIDRASRRRGAWKAVTRYSRMTGVRGRDGTVYGVTTEGVVVWVPKQRKVAAQR